MAEKNLQQCIVKDINMLDLIGILFILVIAFIMQFATYELPCPLCILQRAGLFFIGFGFLMNVNGSGFFLRNYALSALGAMFMGIAALRQMLLHIVPGSGAYGHPIFSFHLYTWSFIIAALFLFSIFFSMLFNLKGRSIDTPGKGALWMKKAAKIMTALYIVLAIFTAITTFIECGFLYCPDNPIHYKYAQK